MELFNDHKGTGLEDGTYPCLPILCSIYSCLRYNHEGFGSNILPSGVQPQVGCFPENKSKTRTGQARERWKIPQPVPAWEEPGAYEISNFYI